MDKDQAARISVALGNVAGLMAELVRQGLPEQGANPNISFFQSGLVLEGNKLRSEGYPQIADGLLRLRDDLGVIDNG